MRKLASRQPATRSRDGACFWKSTLSRDSVATPWSVRTISMVMEPIPPLRARRAVEAARVADASDEHVRRRAGFVTSVRRQREQEQVLARERELADGHSDVRFSAYVLVTAGSPEQLEEAGAEIEQQAGQARLELCRLDGDQDVAFTYCLPLGRGLR